MHLSKKSAAAALAANFILAIAFLAPTFTQADEWNLKTRFKVNHATEIPGATLEANTPYVIRLYDSPAVRNVVQVLNEDESQMLTTFMGIRSERREPAERTVFTFVEVQPGHPIPVREWFYPGRLSGLEFVYPMDQAREIAAHAREPVLATTGDVNLHDLAGMTIEAIEPLTTELPAATAAAEAAPMPQVEEVEETAAVEQESVVTESEPSFEQESEAEIAQAEIPSEPEIQREKPSEPTELETEPEPVPAELPATAGELPLVGLIGMLCLGAGLGLTVLSAKKR